MNILKITIEGARKSGKSTILQAMKIYLESREFEQLSDLHVTCDWPAFVFTPDEDSNKAKSKETMEIAISKRSR